MTDATAERSCAGCTIKLSEETVSEYLRSNVALIKNMVARGYLDAGTLLRRAAIDSRFYRFYQPPLTPQTIIASTKPPD